MKHNENLLLFKRKKKVKQSRFKRMHHELKRQVFSGWMMMFSLGIGLMFGSLFTSDRPSKQKCISPGTYNQQYGDNYAVKSCEKSTN